MILKSLKIDITVRDVCAYILDRADQYETADPCWDALARVVKQILDGEAQAAKDHGELDADLYRRLDRMSSSKTVK